MPVQEAEPKIIRTPSQTNLAVMVPKSDRGTLYLFPQQTGFHPEKKLLVIKSEDNKFPTIMVNHRVPNSNASTTSVVVDKAGVQQVNYIILELLLIIVIILLNFLNSCYRVIKLVFRCLQIKSITSVQKHPKQTT